MRRALALAAVVGVGLLLMSPSLFGGNSASRTTTLLWIIGSGLIGAGVGYLARGFASRRSKRPGDKWLLVLAVLAGGATARLTPSGPWDAGGVAFATGLVFIIAWFNPALRDGRFDKPRVQ